MNENSEPAIIAAAHSIQSGKPNAFAEQGAMTSSTWRSVDKRWQHGEPNNEAALFFSYLFNPRMKLWMRTTNSRGRGDGEESINT
jgi:hypothetical protein